MITFLKVIGSIVVLIAIPISGTWFGAWALTSSALLMGAPEVVAGICALAGAISGITLWKMIW